MIPGKNIATGGREIMGENGRQKSSENFGIQITISWFATEI